MSFFDWLCCRKSEYEYDRLPDTQKAPELPTEKAGIMTGADKATRFRFFVLLGIVLGALGVATWAIIQSMMATKDTNVYNVYSDLPPYPQTSDPGAEYELLYRDGYPVWVLKTVAHLLGPSGDQGVQGEIGPQGPVGPIGSQGIQGIQGERGLTGLHDPHSLLLLNRSDTNADYIYAQDQSTNYSWSIGVHAELESIYFFTRSNHPLRLGVNASEAMRIHSPSGYVSIGNHFDLTRLSVTHSAHNATTYPWGSELNPGQLIITPSDTNYRLAVGYDPVNDVGVVQAMHANTTTAKELWLNPNGGVVRIDSIATHHTNNELSLQNVARVRTIGADRFVLSIGPPYVTSDTSSVDTSIATYELHFRSYRASYPTTVGSKIVSRDTSILNEGSLNRKSELEFYVNAGSAASDDASVLRAKIHADGITVTGHVTASGGNVIGDTLTANAAVKTAGGDAGAPSHSFSGDPDTGMYSSAANTLEFATGTTQRLKLDSTGTRIPNTGVQIGTSAEDGTMVGSLHIKQYVPDGNPPKGVQPSTPDPHTAIYINAITRNPADGTTRHADGKIGIQFGWFDHPSYGAGYGYGGMFGIPTDGAGLTTGAITFDMRASGTDENLTEMMRITGTEVTIDGVLLKDSTINLGSSVANSKIVVWQSGGNSFGIGLDNNGYFRFHLNGQDADKLGIFKGVDDASPIAYIVGTGRIRMSSGSSDSPAFSFISEDSTGMYLNGAGVLAFTIAATRRAQLTASGLAVDAISELSTDVGVTIDGVVLKDSTVNLGSSLVNTKIAIYDDGNAMHGLGMSNNKFRFHIHATADDFGFFDSAAGNEIFTIKGTGPIHVSAGTVSAPGIAFKDETGTGIYRSASGYIDLAINGARVAYLYGNAMHQTSKLITVSGSLSTYYAVGIAGTGGMCRFLIQRSQLSVRGEFHTKPGTATPIHAQVHVNHRDFVYQRDSASGHPPLVGRVLAGDDTVIIVWLRGNGPNPDRVGPPAEYDYNLYTENCYHLQTWTDADNTAGTTVYGAPVNYTTNQMTYSTDGRASYRYTYTSGGNSVDTIPYSLQAYNLAIGPGAEQAGFAIDSVSESIGGHRFRCTTTSCYATILHGGSGYSYLYFNANGWKGGVGYDGTYMGLNADGGAVNHVKMTSDGKTGILTNPTSAALTIGDAGLQVGSTCPTGFTCTVGYIATYNAELTATVAHTLNKIRVRATRIGGLISMTISASMLDGNYLPALKCATVACRFEFVIPSSLSSADDIAQVAEPESVYYCGAYTGANAIITAAVIFDGTTMKIERFQSSSVSGSGTTFDADTDIHLYACTITYQAAS